MQRFVILNPKGGSGKTTLATNLAAYWAGRGRTVALIDFDTQGSSTRWAAARPLGQPPVQIIKAFERPAGATRSFQLRPAPGTTHVVVDTPASMRIEGIIDHVRGADRMLIPVLPSEIDIHAASRFIGDLLLKARVRPDEGRLAVIANRTRANTRVYTALMRFLASLQIPLIGTLRDAQLYVRVAGEGLGVHEVPRYRGGHDVDDWTPIIEWLESGQGPPSDSAAS